MSINRKNVNYLIVLSGIIFFLIRWHQTFFVLDENIDSKIIFESITDGYKYFPIFKAFTELSLNISYDNDIINLKNLSAPAGSFYLHSILYLLIRSWSFIILELVFIIIFLGIFYKISRLLDFRRIESFLISLFLYNLPTFLDFTSLSNLNYISVISSDFYSLRFPRPMVTNLFLLLHIIKLINFEQRVSC